MVKIRIFPEYNYKAFYFNGKTVRIALDPNKPITKLKYPEFYDVKITDHCKGNCPWCYMGSNSSGQPYCNIIEKIQDFFGSMTPNQRPFQVAIGGGEPTTHPQFALILNTFYKLGIVPNYTTNGMWVDKISNRGIIAATKLYCGGVAISCHEHLTEYWEKAADIYNSHSIKLNFHFIISDKESIDRFMEIYNEWYYIVDYFVLLPHTAQGRAIEKYIDWEYLINRLPESTDKIAFGAGFYSYLLQKNHPIQVSLYEPESMSKYLDMENMKLYPSSFDLREIKNEV